MTVDIHFPKQKGFINNSSIEGTGIKFGPDDWRSKIEGEIFFSVGLDKNSMFYCYIELPVFEKIR